MTIGAISGASGAYEYIPYGNTIPYGTGPASQENVGLPGIGPADKPGKAECQTCANRRYQDGSGDPGVSFKSPTKLTPNQAASAVPAHEGEHYSREAAKAESEGREVVSNSIRIFTDVCPECGKTYVSGGETRTITKQKEDSAPFAKDFFDATVGKYLTGKNLDESA